MRSPRLPVLLAVLAFCVVLQLPSFRTGASQWVSWYPWNLSPLYALCLFSAATYRNRFWAIGAPLLVYFLGDALILLTGGSLSDAFHPVQLLAYIALLMIAACGWMLRGREPQVWRVGLAAVSGSVLFYLTTNFGSWLVDPMLPRPTGYARSLAGLTHCYVMALPFAWNSFASMIGFAALMFSPFGMAVLTRETASAPQAAPAREPLASSV